MILLMSRSSGNPRFILDAHRLNVALSRAREAVMILGHGRCLGVGRAGPLDALVALGRERSTLTHLRVSGRGHLLDSILRGI